MPTSLSHFAFHQPKAFCLGDLLRLSVQARMGDCGRAPNFLRGTGSTPMLRQHSTPPGLKGRLSKGNSEFTAIQPVRRKRQRFRAPNARVRAQPQTCCHFDSITTLGGRNMKPACHWRRPSRLAHQPTGPCATGICGVSQAASLQHNSSLLESMLHYGRQCSHLSTCYCHQDLDQRRLHCG